MRTSILFYTLLAEPGSFKRSIVGIGRPAMARTVLIEEVVLIEIKRNPKTSTLKIAHELNISFKKPVAIFVLHIMCARSLVYRFAF